MPNNTASHKVRSCTRCCLVTLAPWHDSIVAKGMHDPAKYQKSCRQRKAFRFNIGRTRLTAACLKSISMVVWAITNSQRSLFGPCVCNPVTDTIPASYPPN